MVDQLNLTELKRSFSKRYSRIQVGDYKPLTRTSSGFINLDLAIGGGIPDGLIMEIWGPEGAGKTSLCLSILAHLQTEGQDCAFVDMERRLNVPEAMERYGISDRLFYLDPSCGEDAMNFAIECCTNGFKAVVIDSVPYLMPKKMMEDTEAGGMAPIPRLMRRYLPNLQEAARDNNTIVIFINQVTMNTSGYGNPESHPGGKPFAHAKSLSLEIRKGSKTPFAGISPTVKVGKNSTYRPDQEFTLDLYFESGFDKIGCLVDAMITSKLIEVKGSWVYFSEALAQELELEAKIAQGKEGAKGFIRDRPDLYATLYARLLTLSAE